MLILCMRRVCIRVIMLEDAHTHTHSIHLVKFDKNYKISLQLKYKHVCNLYTTIKYSS